MSASRVVAVPPSSAATMRAINGARPGNKLRPNNHANIHRNITGINSSASSSHGAAA